MWVLVLIPSDLGQLLGLSFYIYKIKAIEGKKEEKELGKEEKEAGRQEVG